MKIVIDMNLSPTWVAVFEGNGWEAVHWSQFGDPQASDQKIMAWARANNHIVFTHDLDFGTLLALTYADGPSVVQTRTQNVAPNFLGPIVVAEINRHIGLLEEGALLTIDQSASRVRILPLTR